MKRFFSLHNAALRDALRRLFSSPLNTLLSLLVIGIAMALPSAGWVVLDNLNGITGGAAGVQQISLFMTVDASKEDVAAVEARLRETVAERWRFISKEDALASLQSANDMAEIIASLPSNPLPDAFIVEPADTRPDAMEALAATFSGWPKVDHVQLDSAWIKRFHAFMRIGRLALSLLAGLFAVALVAVTFNTIRLQILAQAAEIEVAKLIGATNSYIHRPFQYYGALQGALGGLFAALLVTTGTYLLSAPVADLVALYGGSFAMHGLSAHQIAVLASAGGLLGWIGAQLSVAIHLRRVG